MKTHSSLLPALGKLRHDQRGVSAIEFALIAPLMALFYMGTVELASTLLVDRKITAATTTIGDLVARENTMSNCAIDEIFDAAVLIFEPYDGSAARIRVSSIAPNAGAPTQMDVQWGYANANWTERAAGTTVTLPNGVMAANGSVIMAEIEYTYSPPFNSVFQTDPTLVDVFYMRPRGVNQLPLTTQTCP
ncbi:MAG: TadE/TadG family type IV pilus assembly protein [Pseudomonadota bacterium]